MNLRRITYLLKNDISVKIGCYLLFFLLFWYSCLYESKSDKIEEEIRKSHVEESDAFIMSQHFVKLELNNAKADFPIADFKYWHYGNDTSEYTIKSYVEYKNAYNSTIRMNYRVVMKHTPDCDALNPDCYQLIDIDFTL